MPSRSFRCVRAAIPTLEVGHPCLDPVTPMPRSDAIPGCDPPLTSVTIASGKLLDRGVGRAAFIVALPVVSKLGWRMPSERRRLRERLRATGPMAAPDASGTVSRVAGLKSALRALRNTRGDFGRYTVSPFRSTVGRTTIDFPPSKEVWSTNSSSSMRSSSARIATDVSP